MSKFKVKRLTAHILMLKVINDMLKYSFHLTLTQVKLLNLLVKYDNSDSNSASIDSLLKMKEIQSKMALLQMLSYLNNHQWLLKGRDQRDQRKLTISINKMHIDKIEYMNNELTILNVILVNIHLILVVTMYRIYCRHKNYCGI